MKRILVIDDDSEIRSMFTDLLTGEGYDVVTAENARCGLGHTQSREFDLVITDLYMPDNQGLELIRYLHSAMPDLKIMAMSGGGRPGNRNPLKEAVSAGAHAALRKPFGRQQVLNMLSELLFTPGRRAHHLRNA